MGDLTEQEIFECIGANATLAAEHCDALAKMPQEGETYTALCDCLTLIEGACRQASAWRGDTRWLLSRNLAAIWISPHKLSWTAAFVWLNCSNNRNISLCPYLSR